ncbi:hypothetical protein HYT55_01450 [Candidatus Woesearchaeota archaeon]|nr:hypothetical protein [Candidatus Woesearchaeota archaeon]
MSPERSLVKAHSPSLKKSSRFSAPDGKEILQNLIAVADEADRQCKPELLARGWEGGHFAGHIDGIVHQLGLAERERGVINPPLNGFVTHFGLPQARIVPLSRYIRFDDHTTFSQLPSDKEVLATLYFIDYSLWHSERYYNPNAYDDPKGYLWGSRRAAMLNFFHTIISEARGCRDRSVVEREIGDLLSPHRLNEFPFSVGALSHRDIFEYGSRLFVALNHQDIRKLGSGQRDSDKINTFDSVELFWRISFHCYHSSKEVLLGSIPLNSTLLGTPPLPSLYW